MTSIYSEASRMLTLYHAQDVDTLRRSSELIVLQIRNGLTYVMIYFKHDGNINFRT